MGPRIEDRMLHIDGDRTVDNLAHLVPAIHLTLTSILQAFAFGALLAHVEVPGSPQPSVLAAAFIAHHFYVPHLATFLLILLAWNASVYTHLFFHKPLTITSAALPVLMVGAEVATCASVDSVGQWVFWFAITVELGAVLRWYGRVTASTSLYHAPGEPHTRTPRLWRLYCQLSRTHDWLLSLPVAVLGLSRSLSLFSLAHTVQIGTLAIIPFDFVSPILLLIASLWGAHFADQFYARYLEAILATCGSRYAVGRNGRIEERSQPYHRGHQRAPLAEMVGPVTDEPRQERHREGGNTSD